MQVLVAPIVLPASGVVQVPRDTEVADPQESAPAAQRTSYLAGSPVPSVTSMNERVTELSVTLGTAKLPTVPGFAGGGGGGGAMLVTATALVSSREAVAS